MTVGGELLVLADGLALQIVLFRNSRVLGKGLCCVADLIYIELDAKAIVDVLGNSLCK